MKKLVFAAAIFCLLSPLLHAESSKVTVTEVGASGSGGEVTIDRRLEDLRESLVKRFVFSKYSYLSSKSQSIEKDSTATWKLSDGNYLDVTFKGSEGKGAQTRYTLTLEVYSMKDQKRTRIMKATYKRTKGEALLVGLGQLSSGEKLILVIKAA